MVQKPLTILNLQNRKPECEARKQNRHAALNKGENLDTEETPKSLEAALEALCTEIKVNIFRNCDVGGKMLTEAQRHMKKQATRWKITGVIIKGK